MKYNYIRNLYQKIKERINLIGAQTFFYVLYKSFYLPNRYENILIFSGVAFLVSHSIIFKYLENFVSENEFVRCKYRCVTRIWTALCYRKDVVPPHLKELTYLSWRNTKLICYFELPFAFAYFYYHHHIW